MNIKSNADRIIFLCISLLLWGITSNAGAGSALLTWQANNEGDVQSYNVYYGTASRDYAPPIPVASGTSCQVDNLEDGRAYYFAVTAVDTSGNESGYSTEQSKLISSSNAPEEDIAPVVTILSPSDAENYITNSAFITLAGSAVSSNPIERVTLSLPTGEFGEANGTNEWSLSGTLPAEGIYEISVSAEDTFGNTGHDTITITYTTASEESPPPDETAPSVSILSPTSSGSHQTAQAALAVSGSAQDGGGIAEVTWYTSNGQSGTAAGTTDWSVSGITLQEGTNTITVTAVDAAGNVGTDTLSVTYTAPDTTRPEVAITSPVSANTYTAQTATIALAGTAGDDSGVAEVTWSASNGNSGVAAGTESWTIDDIALAEGETVITVTATDSAGNAAQDTLTVTYVVSSVEGLPVVAVTSSEDDGNVASNTIDNDLSTRWSAHGDGQWIQYDLGATFSISHVLIAYAWGDSINANSEFEILVSNDANSWSSVFKGQSSGTTLQQESYSVSNATGRFLRIVGYGNANNEWNSITEADIVGVTAATPDVTSPSVSILSPTSSDSHQTDQATLAISGSAQDDGGIARVTWSASNGQSGTASGTTEWRVDGITLQEGANTITVTAVDAAGNVGTDTLSVTYTAPDTTSPEVAITSPVSANTYTAQTATIALAGTAGDDSGVAEVAWSASTGSSGVAAGTDSWAIDDIALAEGETVITVTATDSAGNAAQDALTVTYNTALDYDLMVSTSSDLSNASSLAGRTVSGTIYVFLTPEDQVAEVAFALDGQATRVERQAPFELGYSDTTTLTNGSHTASGRITLLDGSTPTVSAAFTVQNEVTPPPDETAPSLSILSPTSGDSYQSDLATLAVSGSAQDEGGVAEVTWSASNGQSGTASGTTEWSVSGINIAEDETVITVEATDNAGNVSHDTLTVSYRPSDTTAPTIEITSPTTKKSYFSRTATVAIGGTAGDNTGIEKIMWENSRGENGVCDGTTNWQTFDIPLDRWWNTIKVTAYDKQGNSSQAELTVFRWR